MLESIIPEEIVIPTSFEMVGTIAHINLSKD